MLKSNKKKTRLPLPGKPPKAEIDLKKECAKKSSRTFRKKKKSFL